MKMDKKGNQKKLLKQLYQILQGEYGPQNWWPAETPFEVVVGAILTQNTAWTNVEKSIVQLKKEKSLAPDAISSMPLEKLQKLIRSSGFFKTKGRRLKEMAARYAEIEDTYGMPIEKGRETLLGFNGIGPETADSILLYAGNRPTFVVDAYTKRFVKRYGLLAGSNSNGYERVKTFFERNLERDARLFNEWHALIVKHSKECCRKKPLCGGCPLSNGCKKMFAGE